MLVGKRGPLTVFVRCKFPSPFVVFLLLLSLFLTSPRLLSSARQNVAVVFLLPEWLTVSVERPVDICTPSTAVPLSDVQRALTVLERAAQENPRAQFILGLAHCLNGRREEAMRAWTQVVRRNPRYSWAAFYLARAASVQGEVVPVPEPDKVAATAKEWADGKDPETAAAWYRLALQYHPTPDIAARLANFYLRRKDAESARRVWEQVADAWPVTHPYHWRARGERAALAKQWVAAAQYFAHAAFRAQDETAYTLYLRAGDLWNQAKRPEQAIQAYRKAVATDPSRMDAYLRLGHVYRGLKAYEEAAAWYRRAAQVAPQRYEPLYYLGILYREQRLYAQALRYFDQALALRPKAAGILYNKALTLAAMDRRPEAVAVLAQAIEAHSNPPQGWRDTKAWWEKYPHRRLDPNYWWERGRFQEQRRLWRTAARFYRQGAKVAKPPDDYRLLLREALMWRYLRRPEEARRIYLDLVARYPERMDPYIGLGDLARGARDWVQAMRWYRGALAAAPQHDAPWYYMAVTAYSAGWHQAALEYINRALARRPDNSWYLYYKALALKDLNRTPEAIAALRQAIDNHPRPPRSWEEQLRKWDTAERG